MKQVHILYEPAYSANGTAFIFPLRFNRQRLQQQYGLKLRFFSVLCPELFECDVLCISSRFFREFWDDGGARVIAFLADARLKVRRIVWFDINDSTGTTQFKVLPHVDLYCKNQVLRDRQQYRKQYYGSRIFTDFYHRTFQVEDGDPGAPHLNHIPDEKDLAKIAVGWNSGLAHYGYWGMRLNKLWHHIPWLPREYPRNWPAPSPTRSITLSCRIGTQYPRSTASFPRQEIVRQISARGISIDKLNRRRYFRELKDSIAAVSPFGLGEITLRDFEIVVCGAAIIKQDMSHLETWPNLWQKGMYLPLQWDFSDFSEKIEYTIQNRQGMVELAQRAQKYYSHLLLSEEGHQEFYQRFMSIVAI